MTNKEAIDVLKNDIEICTFQQEQACDMAIKALEKISHLIDRPCEACEFRKDKGCCKWGCIFENGGDSE